MTTSISWFHDQLASELESDLRDTAEWGRKWLVNFNAEKTQLVLSDRSNNTGAIDVKMEKLFLRKNHLLRCWGWLSLLNWIWALTLPLLLKLLPTKLELWFVLWSFFLQRLLCFCINLPYGHAWNTVVMSGLVLLIATWNCWISYKTNMQDCWSFTCCISWTLDSSSKCSQLKSFL